MPFENRASPMGGRSAREPSDEFLLAGVLAGDEAALRKIIARYDRLVRYTIYRASKTQCTTDPQWLDSVASSAWAGFVQTLRRGGEQPKSLAALLATIARNHVISALRSLRPLVSQDDPAAAEPAAPDAEDPALLMTELELVEALRECSAELEADDRAILSQMTLLLERRWSDAAAALGTSESTLRYRWTRVLGRLRDCVEGKTGRPFAPRGAEGDS